MIRELYKFFEVSLLQFSDLLSESCEKSRM